MRPVDISLIAAIRDQVRAIDPEDTDLLADMIEGETDAGELMDWLLESEATASAHIAANKERARQLSERNARLQARIDASRDGMQKLLSAAGLRKMERASATVGIRAVPSKAEGEDITELPEDCVITKYSPDRKAIKARLESGEDIHGWHLTNGGETVSVRRS